MHPLTRALGLGLVAASVAAAVALRPAATAGPAQAAQQAVVQAAAVAAVHDAQAAAVRRAAARLDAARRVAVARHRASLRARAAVAARKPAPTATPAPTAPRAVLTTYKDRGPRLYQSLHYDVTRLGYRIVFKPYAKGLLGFADVHTKTVTIYVRSGESDLVLRHSIAHEIGHVVDFTRGTVAKHLLYLSIRHLGSGLDWYGCDSCTDYRTPAGDWAEVFAQWLAGRGDFRSQLAGAPTSAQLALLAPLFRL